MERKQTDTTENILTSEAVEQFDKLIGPSQVRIRQSLVLDQLKEQRKDLLGKVQGFLDTCVGLEGEEMITAGFAVEKLCEVHHCVLMLKDSKGVTIQGSEFTLRCGRLRPDRGSILVREASLIEKMDQAIVWSSVPLMTVVPLELLDARSHETVFCRYNSRYLGQRTAANNLNSQDRNKGASLGAQSRWKNK